MSIFLIKLKLPSAIYIPCPSLWNYDDSYSFVNPYSTYPVNPYAHQHAFISPQSAAIKSSKKASLEILKSSSNSPEPFVYYADSSISTNSQVMSKNEDVKSVTFSNFMGKLNPNDDQVKGVKINLTQEDEWRNLPEELIYQEYPAFGGEIVDENDLQELQKEMQDSIHQQSKTQDYFKRKPFKDYSNDWMNEIIYQEGDEEDDEDGDDVQDDNDDDEDSNKLEQLLDKELEEVDQFNGQQQEVEKVLMKTLKGSTSLSKKRIPSRLDKLDQANEEYLDSVKSDDLNEWIKSKAKEARFGERKKPRDIISIKLPKIKSKIVKEKPSKKSYKRVKNLTFKTVNGKNIQIQQLPTINPKLLQLVGKLKRKKKNRKRYKNWSQIGKIKIRKKSKPKKLIQVIPLPEADNDDDDEDDDKSESSKKIESGYIIVPESKKKFKKTDYFPFQYNVEMRSRKSKQKDDDKGNGYKLHHVKEEEHLHEKKWKKKGFIKSDQFGDSDESVSGDDAAFRIAHLDDEDDDIFDNYREKSSHNHLNHFKVPSNGFRVDSRFIDWTEKPIDMDKLEFAPFKDLI